MHIPKKFQQNDVDQLNGIIQQYPFGTLVTYASSSDDSGVGLEANHLPFILTQSDGEDVLQGHIAKVNPLWKNVHDKSEVLVVFSGPNCYVSPNYYPTKKKTGKVVPTWNYVTVHVKGTMSYIYDDQLNLDMINQLTTHHESSQAKPWSTADAPDEYIQKMLPAIVGLEIAISSVTGQWKLSQNQPERNQHGVVEGLSQSHESELQKVADFVDKHVLGNV